MACMAALLALIGLLLPGSHLEARASPLYWGLLIPFAWWASGLGAYKPRAVRTLRPALVLAPALAAGTLVAVLWRGEEPTTWIIACAVSFAGAMASAVLYDRSMLKHEGPAR